MLFLLQQLSVLNCLCCYYYFSLPYSSCCSICVYLLFLGDCFYSLCFCILFYALLLLCHWWPAVFSKSINETPEHSNYRYVWNLCWHLNNIFQYHNVILAWRLLPLYASRVPTHTSYTSMGDADGRHHRIILNQANYQQTHVDISRYMYMTFGVSWSNDWNSVTATSKAWKDWDIDKR